MDFSPKSTTKKFVLNCLWRGEYGDAELFAKMFGGKVIYSHGEGWYIWNGNWELDEKNRINNLLPLYVAARYEAVCNDERKQVKENGDSHDINAKELNRRAKLLRSIGRISRVLTLASGMDGMGISSDEWDADTSKFPVKNGLIDLSTGKLLPPDANHYAKIICPTEYGGLSKKSPIFDTFLRDIFNGDDEIIAFVQRLFGYAISGKGTEHIFPILVGENGRNGKDTLLETMQYVLGDFASPVGNEVLLSGMSNPNAATPHLVSLKGLRLAWVSETDESARLNVNQIKLITGGGTISARQLYSKPIKFKPTHTVMLITNFKPQANADDIAFWKRAILVNFPMEFTDNPQKPNERKIDRSLKWKLQQEASGILAWLVNGFLMYQKEGLSIPKSVISDVEKYRDDEDAIGAFLSDNVLIFSEYEVNAAELYREYSDWCHENGIKALTGIKFANRIKKKYPRKRKSDGYYYSGIGLVEKSEDKERSF